MTNSPAARLTALDCLARGGAILRANWRLVPLRLVLVLVMALLSILALGLPVVVTGGEGLARWPTSPAQWQGWIEELVAQVADHQQVFAISLVGTLLLLAVVLVVWSFTEAGTYGVLYSADRQVPSQAPAGVWFETFSMREFFGWGGTTVWRFLVLALLNLALSLALALLWWGLSALALSSGDRWGAGAGIGLGCGGALPLLFLLFSWVAVFWLAKAALPAQDSRSFAALGMGVRILSRRLGTAFVLLGAWIGASFGLVVMGSFVSGFAVKVVGVSSMTLLAVGSFLVQLVQSLLGQVLGLWIAAAFVVLVRSERQAAIEEAVAVSAP